MNYKKRIEKIRQIMEERKLNAILLPSDATWEYVTGIPRLWKGNTTERQNSAEFTGLLITDKDVIILLPRLTSLGIIDKIKENKIITEFVIYQDIDLTGTTFKNKLIDLGLEGKNIGVNRDISATCVIIMQETLNIKIKDISRDIDMLRSIKDNDEIKLMKEASAITDKIFEEILPMVKPGTLTREIEREIDILLEKHGCQKSSFPSAVMNHGPLGGNSFGDSYHTVSHNHTIAFDFGVVKNGYCSDFGRTVFIGEPSKELRRIHKLIMESQKVGMEAMKAGKATGAEVNKIARKVIEDAGYKEAFVHRLGHGIGKDVHERPFLAEGEETILSPGMTFTVEPSIFLPQKTLVRVEDVVLVTETGYECLNKATKEILVVE